MKTVIVISLAGGLWSAPACAAPSFHAAKDYPNLGLRFRALSAGQPEPLAQYKTFTYTFARGAETSKRDLFDPRELWYATQHAGQWRDGHGNVMILGKPTRLLPAVPVIADKYVSREDFDKAVADPAAAFDPATAEDLTAWLSDFAGVTPGAPEPLRTTSFNLACAVFIPVEEDATVVHAFRVKTRAANGQSVPSDWFVAVVRIGDKTPLPKVRKDFETQFLANVAALPRSSASAASGVRPKALTAVASGSRPPAPIPEHPSRSAARASVANMEGWWYAETPDYIFLSNIRSAQGRRLVAELQVVMPILRRAFATLIPPPDDRTDVSVVRIFEDPEAYKQYVGKDIAWSVGVWIPMRRELVILAQERDQARTVEIIRHEGFHQYLFYAFPMLEHAMWFNEGHACFFEAAAIDGKGLVTIRENSRAALLLDKLALAADRIPALLYADGAAFYGGSEEQRSLNYAAAWGLVYFLRKGVPAGKPAGYADILSVYLANLVRTRDAAAATRAAFANVDMPAFQEAFTDFWRKGRGAATRYDPLADPKPSR